ncbi:MAG: hypothetical protein ABSH03_01670 [Candidatus Lustribacter sp.]
MEIDELRRRIVSGLRAVASEDEHTDFRGIECFALDREESELIHGIERPKLRIEFQAVDDLGIAVQPDVLGPQVSVRFDDAPLSDAPVEQRRVAMYEGELRRVDKCNLFERQDASRFPELIEIRRNRELETLPIIEGVQRNRRGVPVKRTQPNGKSLDVVVRIRSIPDRLIEHPVAWKPVHLDEPIDRRSVTAERELAVRSRDRDGVDIYGRCEAPVESNFFLAEVSSQFDR